MTEKEENIWMLLITAWLSNTHKEKIKEIKVSPPQDNEELRNAIQQKISDLQEKLKND